MGGVIVTIFKDNGKRLDFLLLRFYSVKIRCFLQKFNPETTLRELICTYVFIFKKFQLGCDNLDL
jgi:hypothetical protein